MSSLKATYNSKWITAEWLLGAFIIFNTNVAAKTDNDEWDRFVLRSWKQTDADIEVLSMGRLRLVATHMNRSLTKVRDRMSEKMVQAPPM